MDVTFAGLRVLRAVAQRGTFTAAAQELGYTQSAVSRQVAALESGTGHTLFRRRSDGVTLTAAGAVLLRHAVVALDAVEAAGAELTGEAEEMGRLRLGVTPIVSALVLPRAAAAVRRGTPRVDLTTREGSTSSLLRALRAGTLDAAVLTSRPPHRHPDSGMPRLRVEPLLETRLVLAVPSHGRYAGRDSLSLDELDGERWIASPSTADEPQLGVWPGMPGHPRVTHLTRDWLVKLQLVAAGAGVTTVPATIAALLPDGAHLATVADAPEEQRRISLVRMPGAASAALAGLVDALRDQAARLAS